MRKLFTFMMLSVLASMAWAAQTTVDFAAQFESATETVEFPNVTVDGYAFTFEQGNSTTTPKFFVPSGQSTAIKAVRMYGGSNDNYAGNTVAISAPEGETMTKVVFAGGTSNSKYREVTASTGTVNYDAETYTLTWEGSASELTFTVMRNGDGAGQFHFVTVDITTQEGGEDPEPVVIAAPTFNPAAGEVEEGTVVTITGPEGYNLIYTLDGTIPEESFSSAMVFTNTATVTINAETTIKAQAFDDEFNLSEVAEATYTIKSADVEEEDKTLPYEESFESSLGDFDIDVIAIDEALSWVWTHDNRGYAKASAYLSSTKTNYATHAQLVSPVINAFGFDNVTLNFTEAGNHFQSLDNMMDLTRVYVVPVNESNGVKANVEIDDNAIDITPSAEERGALGSSWTWADQVVDLGQFSGQRFQIVFDYTSTTEVAGTWEVKNFAVTGDINTGVTEVISGDVANVRYYNLQGQESEVPFAGVNVVVTTMTNGTKVASKVIK